MDKAKVTLHWLNASRAQRVLWLMLELKVPYELALYHRAKTGFAPPELRKVHPLGKSPVITIELPTPGAEPIVLAESGLITEYLCEHWGRDTTLVPKHWQEGKENQIGGETAAYLRHKYLLHFAEGTMMPYLVFFLVTSSLRSTQVPWYIRPISTAISNKINSVFLLPNVRRNLELIENFLANPPSAEDGTGYLCGGHLTAADILLSYPLIASRMRASELGDLAGNFPKTFEYVERLEKEPGYQASVKKVEEIDGKFSVLPDTK